MTENVPTQELEPQPVKDIKFVEKAADEMSDVLSKYAIVPTPDALLLQEEELTSKTDEQIAEMLKKVEVIDPTFEPQNMEASSDQGVFNVGVLAAAKAKSVAAQTENKDVKRRLEEWEERVLSGVSSKIAKIGGKKATGIALAGIVSIGMTACGVSGVAGVNPGQVPTESAPRVTQVTEIPTETQTPAPTEVPTPTENPNAISSQEIIDGFGFKLEISGGLEGKALINGEQVDTNYPNLDLDIIYGLDPAVMNRGPETHFLPYTSLEINKEYQDKFGVNPENEMRAVIWYGFYKGWQHSEDDKYIDQRQDVSFTDYLSRVQSGEDMAFPFWVITQKGRLTPDSRVNIDPKEMKNVVIEFADETSSSRIVYFNEEKSTLVLNVQLKADYDSTLQDPWVKTRAFWQVVNNLSVFAWNSDSQHFGSTDNTREEDRTRIWEVLNAFKYSEQVFNENPPLLSISPGWSSN